MIVKTGFFDETGAPCVRLGIEGAFARCSAPGDAFHATLDTGFAGFLSMPLDKAFPLGLPLINSVKITLADGAVHEKITALA